MSRKIHCETLDRHVELAESPRRIVSLFSGATETIDEMEGVAGGGSSCARYIPDSVEWLQRVLLTV